MEEIFKVVHDFPTYEISNFGRIRTKSRRIRYTHAVTKNEHFRLTECRMLQTCKNSNGYLCCQLYKDKKSYNKRVHRLVAEAFLEKIQGLDTVNHIDGNKINNFVNNLEWCTDSQNHIHAVNMGLQARGSDLKISKLNEKGATAIKRMLNDGFSKGYIARLFDVSRTAVILIAQGKTWKHCDIQTTHKL